MLTLLIAFLSAILLGIGAPSLAQAWNNGLSRTPPMGWSSWPKFGCNVDESLIKRQADALIRSGMRDTGYQYVNIDDCWEVSRDNQGQIVADPTRFPDGIKALADYVHQKGLKLGIYTSAGRKTCQGRPGSYGHEQQDANTYASWGIDYVKDDWCDSAGLDAQTQYTKMRDALAHTERPMVFSICEWGVNAPWVWGPRTGNLWRTTPDIEDNWLSMLSNLDSSSQHAAAAGPGHWNDPDFLEVGNGGMMESENRAQLSMWAIMAAPLIAGNDLPTMSSATATTLMNPEVIAVDQDLVGIQGTKVSDNGTGLQVWSKPLHAQRSRAIALFNRSDAAAKITVTWQEIGLAPGRATVRDLWAHADRGPFTDQYTAAIGAHDVVLLKIVGTDRTRQSEEVESSANSLAGGSGVARCSLCSDGKP